MALKPVPAADSDAGASPESLAALRRLEQELGRVVDEKSALIRVTLCALLSSGHVLLEDVPGVGKTTFIKALAKLLGLDMARIQFTSDLLPSDIVGVEVFDPEKRTFTFHKGPVFTQILLADELNRASPRTQSALLEAMGEGHVTVDRRSHELPRPFLVLASQNPNGSAGTYELPESQLDRFAARLRMGYPTERRELEILQTASRDPVLALPAGVLSHAALIDLQDAVERVHVAERVARYAKRLIDFSRNEGKFRVGVSTRGGVAWLRMARAHALIAGRNYVVPDDLRELALPCLGHRVTASAGALAEKALEELLARTPVD